MVDATMRGIVQLAVSMWNQEATSWQSSNEERIAADSRGSAC